MQANCFGVWRYVLNTLTWLQNLFEDFLKINEFPCKIWITYTMFIRSSIEFSSIYFTYYSSYILLCDIGQGISVYSKQHYFTLICILHILDLKVMHTNIRDKAWKSTFRIIMIEWYRIQFWTIFFGFDHPPPSYGGRGIFTLWLLQSICQIS